MISGIISSVIASIIVGASVWFFRSAQLGGLKRFRIFEPRGDQLNSEFYDYFRKQIDDAKTEIIVTGEGFEYKGMDGPKHADAYHASMRSALQRGVDITRIQTARPLNPRWAEKLKECLRDFPERFHLYIVKNRQFQDIASVCVVDADMSSNVVEFMLSAENDLEDESVRIASTGVFIHGRKDLARAMKTNVVAIKRFSLAKKCMSEADIDEFLS